MSSWPNIAGISVRTSQTNLSQWTVKAAVPTFMSTFIGLLLLLSSHAAQASTTMQLGIGGIHAHQHQKR
jgi:hypothetical protein